MKTAVLALDAGTTSSRAIVFDKDLKVLGVAQEEFRQYYPVPGWVEHDPEEIWKTQRDVMSRALQQAGVRGEEVAGIGITNQRETTIVWEKKTGRPIHNAIVWQCRRTAELCDVLAKEGWGEHVKKTTGLVVDAYFSATKIAWILDHVEGARERAYRGELLFGTVDTWLIWKLTEGKAHVTDVTNAGRTMLYDIEKLDWDDALLKRLGIPRSMLPKVVDSSGIYGYYEIDGVSVPIAGAIGDQQAALFGQGCFESGEAKNTYGTGAFLLMNTGEKRIESHNGLLTTIAVGYEGTVRYALEGSIFIAGAVIQWVRDELHLLDTSSDAEYFATKEEDNGGVYFVPAFTGLGAPHWDPYARGSIFGLSRGSNKNHIIRAALESIAFQTVDVLAAMEIDAGISLSALNVDGGASRNNFLMQFQADLLRCPVRRPVNFEMTAMGAAMVAGLATGFFSGLDSLSRHLKMEREFVPSMSDERRRESLERWREAVKRSREWEKSSSR